MFSLEIDCPPDRSDLLIAELWECGVAGIVELDGGRLRAFFEDSADIRGLSERFHALARRQEEDRDWIALSRAQWEPLPVGSRFFLVPGWLNDPAPDGRFRIVVNPGMAFGTGVHETTQLCLEALEDYVRPGRSLLDVGTGSGILAQAARLLGAAPVWTCDIDPIAVEIARGNGGLDAFIGSVDAVRPGCADLVVANISPEAIAALAPELLRCLAAGGSALVSGFERGEATAVQTALERHGGVLRESRAKRNWAMSVFNRGSRLQE